ncbi:MAG: hypothetical protein JO323_17445 [Acidobacteriia bacterium]|nr:hypothetical protein [Terriglobia bacterium]
MTWRLLIFSSVTAAALLPAATVKGRVVLRDSREHAVRAQSDFSGVVIWLEPPAPLALPRNQRAKMLQKDKTFIPHVLAVTVGTMVDLPNLDPIFHNAFSNYDGQLFDLGLYPPRSSKGVRFTRPGLVRVFCNIHSTMSAVIAVMDTPYFAVTKENGRFEIANVPEGTYGFRIFHERATDETLARLNRQINVTEDPEVDLGEIVISETGYLAIPHNNKYGKAYTPAPDDGGVYPATRK